MSNIETDITNLKYKKRIRERLTIYTVSPISTPQYFFNKKFIFF